MDKSVAGVNDVAGEPAVGEVTGRFAIDAERRAATVVPASTPEAEEIALDTLEAVIEALPAPKKPVTVPPPVPPQARSHVSGMAPARSAAPVAKAPLEQDERMDSLRPFYKDLEVVTGERAELEVADLSLRPDNPYLASSLVPPAEEPGASKGRIAIGIAAVLALAAGGYFAFARAAAVQPAVVPAAVAAPAVTRQEPVAAATAVAAPVAAQPVAEPAVGPAAPPAEEPQAVEPPIEKPAPVALAVVEPAKVKAPVAPAAGDSAATVPEVAAKPAAVPAVAAPVVAVSATAPSPAAAEAIVPAAVEAPAAPAATPAAEAAPATVVAAPPAEAAPVSLPETPTREQVAAGFDALKPELLQCAAGKTGVVVLDTTLASTGRIAHALIDGNVFKGTPEGSCMARAVRKARFPQFSQPTLKVRYPVQL